MTNGFTAKFGRAEQKTSASTHDHYEGQHQHLPQGLGFRRPTYLIHQGRWRGVSITRGRSSARLAGTFCRVKSNVTVASYTTTECSRSSMFQVHYTPTPMGLTTRDNLLVIV
jgi:hypothetical protein